MNAISLVPAARPSWPTVDDPDNGLRPAPIATVIAQLGGCLTLVRPVGMSESEAEDWLTVASHALRELPDDLLVKGCEAARLACTHHRHIVPAIFKAVEADWTWRKAQRERALAGPNLAAALPSPPRNPLPPMTQDDVDAMPAHFVSLGIAAGFLIRTADGQVRLAPDDSEVAT